eukprot:2048360-Pyramimonas_sp.AAC.1
MHASRGSAVCCTSAMVLLCGCRCSRDIAHASRGLTWTVPCASRDARPKGGAPTCLCCGVDCGVLP